MSDAYSIYQWFLWKIRINVWGWFLGKFYYRGLNRRRILTCQLSIFSWGLLDCQLRGNSGGIPDPLKFGIRDCWFHSCSSVFKRQLEQFRRINRLLYFYLSRFCYPAEIYALDWNDWILTGYNYSTSRGIWYSFWALPSNSRLGSSSHDQNTP